MVKKFNKVFKASLVVLAVFTVAICVSCNANTVNKQNSKVVGEGISTPNGYTLEQSTILSRHNLRSPLQATVDKLNSLSPHEWMKWTAGPEELSVVGSQSEVLMGIYYKKYFESINFIPPNWEPQGNEALVFSNSWQRNLATSQCFAAGFIPASNIDITHRLEAGKEDRLFTTHLNYNNDKFKEDLNKEYNSLGGYDNLQDYVKSFQDNADFVCEVADFKDSQYAKEHNIEKVDLSDAYVEIGDVGSELKASENIQTINKIAEGLSLQYLETEDDEKACFGKKLSTEDWDRITCFGDLIQQLQFGTHTLGVNAAHQILIELQNEMSQQGRKFTFLCAHDSTVNSVLQALNVADYKTENQISKKAPMGVKLMINRYKNQAGEEFASVSLVYPTTDQIRHKEMIDLENPPMVVNLDFKGLTKNADGLFKYSDITNRFQEAINEYNNYM